MTATATPDVIEQDGVLIDLNTGEVVGLAGQPPERPFVPDTIERVEWVLERIQMAEARKAGHVAQRNAILFNIEAQIADENRLIAGLHHRFDADLDHFARQTLAAAGNRTKTLKTAFGQISFRMTQGRHLILDMAAAVAWVKARAPERVHTDERVLVPDLKELAAVAEDWREVERFFEATPPVEHMFITTGIAQ